MSRNWILFNIRCFFPNTEDMGIPEEPWPKKKSSYSWTWDFSVERRSRLIWCESDLNVTMLGLTNNCCGKMMPKNVHCLFSLGCEFEKNIFLGKLRESRHLLFRRNAKKMFVCLYKQRKLCTKKKQSVMKSYIAGDYFSYCSGN